MDIQKGTIQSWGIDNDLLKKLVSRRRALGLECAPDVHFVAEGDGAKQVARAPTSPKM